MGNVCSLNEYLRSLDKLLVCPKARRRHFLSEAQRMADDYRQGNLDASDEERLGGAIELKKSAASSICIDHHITNTGFSDVCIIDAKASSTCEVLFEQLELEAISHNVAVALYTGIIHDTGVLKFSNTSKRTLQIVGELVEKGVDTAKIIENIM